MGKLIMKLLIIILSFGTLSFAVPQLKQLEVLASFQGQYFTTRDIIIQKYLNSPSEFVFKDSYVDIENKIKKQLIDQILITSMINESLKSTVKKKNLKNILQTKLEALTSTVNFEDFKKYVDLRDREIKNLLRKKINFNQIIEQEFSTNTNKKNASIDKWVASFKSKYKWGYIGPISSSQ